jgi:hypothetical protein
MKQVFKYPINCYESAGLGARWEPEFTLDMPDGAQILRADMQGERLIVWALVDPNMRMTTRRFRLAGTGHAIEQEDLSHISTFFDGGLVMHLFEVHPVGLLRSAEAKL